MITWTEQKHIYKCSICGNIVKVLHACAGQFVWCGQPMELLAKKKMLRRKKTLHRMDRDNC